LVDSSTPWWVKTSAPSASTRCIRHWSDGLDVNTSGLGSRWRSTGFVADPCADEE
jgi:hypothetical protein